MQTASPLVLHDRDRKFQFAPSGSLHFCSVAVILIIDRCDCFSEREDMAMNVERYDTMGKSISALNLTVAESGYGDLDTRWHSEAIGHPYNILYLVKDGEGVLETKDTRIIMKPNTAYLLPARLPVRRYCVSHLKKLYFHFNIYKPDHYDLLQEMCCIGQLPIDPAWLEGMAALYRGRDMYHALRLQGELLQLISRFQDKYSLGREGIRSYSPTVTQTIQAVQENLSASLRVEDLAKRAFVSRQFLTEVFREEVGVTPGHYIAEQLCCEAQSRLTRTEESIGRISTALGFSDQFYFSRWFKKLTGLTPRQYRNITKDRFGE